MDTSRHFLLYSLRTAASVVSEGPPVGCWAWDGTREESNTGAWQLVDVVNVADWEVGSMKVQPQPHASMVCQRTGHQGSRIIGLGIMGSVAYLGPVVVLPYVAH